MNQDTSAVNTNPTINDNANPKNAISIGEASKYLGVSIDTLRRWEARGRLLSHRSPGGHRYYFKEELDKVYDTKYVRDKISSVIQDQPNVQGLQPTQPVAEPIPPVVPPTPSSPVITPNMPPTPVASPIPTQVESSNTTTTTVSAPEKFPTPDTISTNVSLPQTASNPINTTPIEPAATSETPAHQFRITTVEETPQTPQPFVSAFSNNFYPSDKVIEPKISPAIPTPEAIPNVNPAPLEPNPLNIQQQTNQLPPTPVSILTPTTPSPAPIIPAEYKKPGKFNKIQKMALAAIIIFILVDLLLVFVWFSSGNTISPVPY